jgi:hypothetical protein
MESEHVAHVRKALDTIPGVEAAVVSIIESSPNYRFCFFLSDHCISYGLAAKGVKVEQALESSSCCARTESHAATVSRNEGGAGYRE